MKKLIISTILALALGFIAGFYFRDYHIRKDSIKGQAIEKRDKTMDNDSIPNTLYHKENSWKNPECNECENFGPV